MASTSRIIPNRIRVLHTFDAFHNPGYRRLWPAYLFANVSRWMQMTLLAWLVLGLTESPLRVALVGFFGMGPIPKNPTNATRSGESVSPRTSQASSVICIHRETFANR